MVATGFMGAVESTRTGCEVMVSVEAMEEATGVCASSNFSSRDIKVVMTMSSRIFCRAPVKVSFLLECTMGSVMELEEATEANEEGVRCLLETMDLR